MLDRLGEHFSKPRIHEFNQRTERIAAPLQIVKDEGIFCWYVLGPAAWEFATGDEKEARWNTQRSRWGQIAEGTERGHRPIMIRRTTLPFPAWEWAARLDHATPNPLPLVEGAENWRTKLIHANRRLNSRSLDTRVTMVGLWIAEPPSDEVYEDIVNGVEHPRLEATKLVVDEMMRMLRLVEGGGLNGRFATAADMAFLMHRSLSMGLPLPKNVHGEQWGSLELGEFYDRRRWQVQPVLGEVFKKNRTDGKKKHRAVEVVGIGPDGEAKTSYVIPLSMGMMPKTSWPESGIDAWGVLMDRAEGPKEMVITGELYPGSAMIKGATLMANTAKAVQDHYVNDHGETPPPAVKRAIAEAEETLDQVTEGDNRTGPRFVGSIHIAVYGDTLQQAGDRANKVQALYQDAAHMSLHKTIDPERVLRSFVPGEPRLRGGWTRYLTMGYLAAAMPNIDEQVGTPSGPYLGWSIASQRPVLFDMHYGPEKMNKSGVFWLYGSPGSGKSSLIWHLVSWATSMGQWSRVWDPSGPLAGLVKVPEFAPWASELNLTRAEEGALGPMALVPIPVRENYRRSDGNIDETEYLNDLRASRLERPIRAADTLRMQLPHTTLQLPGVDSMLTRAVRSMEHHEMASRVPQTMWNLRWAIEYLQDKDESHQDLARELEDAADPLIIPTHSDPIEDMSIHDKKLVVITMPGVNPPSGEPEGWGPIERMAVTKLHLATLLCASFVYRMNLDDPKNVFMDESRVMDRFASGRQFIDRTGHDSRKRNLFMLRSSQHPRHHDTESADALVGGIFAGYLSGKSAIDGCDALGISREHAPLFESLDAGEFVFKDAGIPGSKQGRIALIKNDMDYDPTLVKARTTPGIAREEWTGKLAPTPHLDPRLVGSAR